MNETQSILHHLENDFIRPVRDPLWKHIYLTPALERTLHLTPFVRLGRLRQLGLAVQVYPGATHTRANHSLGVFHLAKRIIQTLVRSPAYPGHLTLEGVQAFLCAALFHDLGHFPYAHTLEDGLNMPRHEQLSAQAVLAEPLGPLLRREVGTDPAFVAAIIDHRLTYTTESEQLVFFRRLLSGVLDPDKLDYLNRDAYFCGVPYGIQDADFIVSQIVPHREFGIGLSPKGILSVEHLLFSKYLMYKSVYWHKGVRSPSAMIKKALHLALKDGVLKSSDLVNEDDVSFAVKMSGMPHRALQKIPLAEQPGRYITLWEQAWDENALFAQRLATFDEKDATEDEIRREIERQTGEALDPEDITIDVPHSVSFDVDLPILKEGRATPFPEAGTVFDKSVVHGFTTHLKRLRLIGPERLKGRIRNAQSFFV
ncbi:MAG: HD domain-containing protein [Spirochaetales bacterium]|nr:HD domain-containing protein [Spirochaetales bacterium]